MTFSKAWLSKKIMCGLCNFGCCNSKSFKVEITKEEQEFYQKKFGLDLELEWKQEGCCKLLKDNDTGCSLGDDRPLFCKLYPVTEHYKNNKLVISNWSFLSCPKPENYELDKIVDGKYHYKLKKIHWNKKDKLILDDTIDNVVDEIWIQAKESIIEKYGKDYYKSIEESMVPLKPWKEFE